MVVWFIGCGFQISEFFFFYFILFHSGFGFEQQNCTELLFSNLLVPLNLAMLDVMGE